MKKVNVLSVNISEKKGTVKHPVPFIRLTGNGVEGDAHSGPWNRQVSLLGVESIRKFEKEANRKIRFGEFAENITTEGMELWNCNPLDRFTGDEVELEVTQIGKDCHGSSCAIFKEVGNCVMPKEGIFARVIRAGNLSSELNTQNSGTRDLPAVGETPAGKRARNTGRKISELTYHPRVFTAHVITLSDRAFRGEYEDRSGPRIAEILGSLTINYPLSIVHSVLPDDPGHLLNLLSWSVAEGHDFVFTTGGTGIGPRDFTPDIVRPILDKEIPGIMEMIRIKYGMQKHQALLSRSVAGVAGPSMIFTLPGSVPAVTEYMEEISKSLIHMVYMLHGLDSH